MRLTGDQIVRAAALAAVLVVAVVVAVLLLGGAERRLHGQGALPERRPARQGQPRPDRRRAGRQGQRHRPHRGRPGRGDAEDRRRLRAAAPRHAGHRPPGLAVGCRQPLHRSADGAAEREGDPRQGRHRAGLDDHRGRPRPDLQHLRPGDAQGAAGRHRRLRQPDQGPGQAVQRGHRLPQPVARRLEPPVPRAQPRHAAAGALHRLLLAARHRHRRPPRGPLRPRRPARHHDDRDRQPEGGARGRHRPAARLPAPRQHDVRQPARRARRPRPARRRVQAGGQEAAPVPRRAAPARPRRAPDDQRPLEDRQPPGRRQRPDRADQAAGAAARRHHAQVRRQRQAARGRLQGLPGRAQGRRAGVRLLPPLHARPARLVRRLQPLRHL